MSAAPSVLIDPTWTRELAMSQIEQAKDLAEVFDLANRALGSQRQAWGDPLAASIQSANLWAMASFTVEAQDTIEVHTYSGVVTDVKGETLKACALDSAKALAKGLLAPPEWSQSSVDYLRDEMARELRTINAKHGLVTNNGLNGVHNREVVGLFLGHSLMIASSASLAITDLAKSRMESWEDIDANLKGELKAPSDEATAGPEALGALVNQMGFSRISAGPVGGMREVQRQAIESAKAFEDLALLTGAPKKSMALDGLSVSINQVFHESETAACYNPALRDITTGRPTKHLGHEWTHAAERWIDNRSNNVVLKTALNELRARVSSLAPIPGGFEKPLDILKEENQGRVLTERLKTEGSLLTRWVARRGKLPPGVEHAIMENRRPHADVSKSAARLAEAFNRQLRSSATRMTVEEASSIAAKDRLGHRRYMLYLESQRAGQSVFTTVAKDMDLLSEKNYWATPTELLARASEPYWEKSGNAALSGRQPDSVVVPLREEREQSNEAFSEFFDAFSRTMKVKFPENHKPDVPVVDATNVMPEIEGVRLPHLKLAPLGELVAARRQQQEQAVEGMRMDLHRDETSRPGGSYSR